MTARDLLEDVGHELGVLDPHESLTANQARLGLSKLTRLVDTWNADRQAIVADQLLTFTLTPSLQPHTIGASGATWTTSIRPVSIEGAQLMTDSTSAIRLRTSDWWQALTSPTQTSDTPTDLYYAPTWPLGKLYFWPIPTAATDVQLLVRVALADYDLDTTFTMPPGYRDAMTLTLVESCQSVLGGVVTPATQMAATQARARIFSNNMVVPKLITDMMQPGGGWFDYQTGTYR